MSEAVKEQAKENGSDPTARQAIAEAVRSRITHLHERLGQLETDARGRVYRALSNGNAKLRDLDKTLARVSREDFSVPAVRKQLEGLRARADAARANALKRVSEMPGHAVQALASGTRAPIQTLSNRVAAIARKIEGTNGAPGEKPNGAAGEKPKAANGKQAKS